jgi:hypothetical protein
MVKASNAGQLKQVENLLKIQFEELDVKISIIGNSVNKWVQVSLSGEDEGIAKSYINNQIGICLSHIDNVNNHSIYKGYISNIDTEKNQSLIVDIGIFQPKIIQAAVPLADLQVQLADGKKINLKKISDLYGLVKGLPISIKLIEHNWEENEHLQAVLSIDQIELFRIWQESLLDRLIILGSSTNEIETVLERTRLSRDIINLEMLGMFENVLTCKLGTDAAGIIPRIGTYMKNAHFVLFNPRKVIEFKVEQGLTL